jgi:hypothetical protein
MTNESKSLPRVLGLIILAQSIIGFLINEVMVGPYTFSKDFLTVMAAHSFEITLAMVLGLAAEVLSMVAAVMLLPVFKKQHEGAAYAYLMLSAVTFAAVATDNINIQSLLALSKDYVQAVNPDAHYFQTLGAVAHAARLWTHLMTLLVASLPFSVFFYLMFSSKLIPRFISVWGFIGVAMMASATLLTIFERNSSLLFYVPLGLNQLVLVVWLLVKGFQYPSTK